MPDSVSESCRRKYSEPYSADDAMVAPANAKDTGLLFVVSDLRKFRNKYVSDHAELEVRP